MIHAISAKENEMRKRYFIKHFLYYFGIITIPIVFVFLIYIGFVLCRTRGEVAKNAEKSAAAVRDNYSLVLDTANTQYDFLCRNPRLSISLRKYLSHDKTSYLDSILTNSILSNFTSMTYNSPYIASVYYYQDGYDSVLTSSFSSVISLSRLSDVSWLDSYRNSRKDEWMERRDMYTFSYAQPVPVVTYYKKLNMFRGVVAVNIYADRLRSLLNTGSHLDQFFIVNDSGQLLLAADEKGELFYRNQDSFLGMLENAKETAYQTWISDSHIKYHIRTVPAGSGTYIITCLSQSSYYRALYSILLQFLMVLAAVIGISLWISYAITWKNHRQISYFIDMFSDAERGEYNSEKPDFIKDEYDVILNNIVQLFVNKTFLQNKLALREQQQKLAEMAALQMQINPHFLFNTLQTLDFKALECTGRPTAMNQIIEALSDILKYSLGKPDSSVTLGDEIDNLKKYDSIQRYRYEDKYILYYEYDEELRSVPLMRLILQPLIENSLYHGIKLLPGSGFIKLRINRRKDCLLFSVIDTGVGMTKAEINDLYKKINDPGRENIGLTNVNRRLVMRYGEEAGLRILSKKGMGTCISFRIPLHSSL